MAARCQPTKTLCYLKFSRNSRSTPWTPAPAWSYTGRAILHRWSEFQALGTMSDGAVCTQARLRRTKHRQPATLLEDFLPAIESLGTKSEISAEVRAKTRKAAQRMLGTEF